MSKQPVINSKTLLWLRDKLKMIVNLVKFPPLLSWSISNKGKINPEFEESVKEAPKENWDRLGMDDKVIGSLPQWVLFVLLSLIVLLNYWSGFFAKFGALFPLAVIFYFLIKSWGSKK